MKTPSRFEIVFHAVGDAMLVADNNRRYIDANAAAAALLGVPREQLIGRRIDDFAELKGDVDALWQRFLVEGRLDGDFALRRPDGERRDVEFRAIAHIAPGEHLSVIRDVTEQRRIEEEAAKMRERALHAEAIEEGLRLSDEILQQIPDAVLLADADGKILRWSGAAKHIFGYTFDEARGRDASFLQPAQERERVGAAIVRAIREAGSFKGEVPAQRKDGSIFPAELVVRTLHDARGPVIGLIGVIRDLSELKAEQAARDAAEKDVRFQSLFTGILGHDLRNPLAAIVIGAQLIAQSEANERVTRSAARILGSAERMKRMIDQLLDFTRIRIGDGIALHGTVVDLAHLCDRVREELLAGQPEGQIELTTKLDTVGKWDEDRLQQVFSNLIANALTHGRPGGRVSVLIDGSDEARVVARVHNEGTVAASLLPTLFEPFRTGESRFARSRGLGLGLHITQQIVAAHGGSVTVHSSEAEGTIVEVTLPRRQ
jgi:PAS domain S-box-containing protein